MEHIRSAAATGDMVPGEWYSVYQLSEQLGISRSPVREGLLKLEEAGLIQIVRNRGFQVIETPPEDVAEIFSLRLAIEPPATYRAALYCSREQFKTLDKLVNTMRELASAGRQEDFFALDRELHKTILHAGRSVRSAHIVETLRAHTEILGASTAGSSRSLHEILEEHLPVLGAIQGRNPELAQRLMTEHLTATGKLLLAQSLRKQGKPVTDSAIDDVWLQYNALHGTSS